MSIASSTVSLGKCVVCGKESSTRCSKCSKAGIDWMFFCSQEHQKLVYFAHKSVCGLNPFLWPSISDREVSETIRLMTAHSRRWGAKIVNYLEKECCSEQPRTESEAIANFKKSADEARPSSILDHYLLGRLLDLRSLAYGYRVVASPHAPLEGDSTLPWTETCRLVHQNPLDYMAYLEHDTVEMDWASNSMHAPWVTTLQHRLLIAIALGSIIPENERSNSQFFVHSVEFLRNFALEIATTHPTESEQIKDELLRELTSDLGTLLQSIDGRKLFWEGRMQ